MRRTELEQSGIAADDLQAVLDEYGRHRLLSFDRDPTSRTPTVEVAHEALLTEWERFSGWVDDARDDLLTRKRLESAAHDWVSSGSDASFLYRGGRLELAESWATSSEFELTDDEQRFLATSRAKVERDQAVRTNRRRIVVGVLSAALVLALVGVGVALVQRSKRTTARRTPGRRSSRQRHAGSRTCRRRRHPRRGQAHRDAGTDRGRLRPGAAPGRGRTTSRRLAGDETEPARHHHAQPRCQCRHPQRDRSDRRPRRHAGRHDAAGQRTRREAQPEHVRRHDSPAASLHHRTVASHVQRAQPRRPPRRDVLVHRWLHEWARSSSTSSTCRRSRSSRRCPVSTTSRRHVSRSAPTAGTSPR